MALTGEQLARLKTVFSVADTEFLRGFAYIKEQAITNRIEDVDPSWLFHILDVTHYPERKRVNVRARMTICGVSRDGIGSADYNDNPDKDYYSEAEKSAATDALKRCARLFGVGRYLLDLPNNVKDAQSLGKWLSKIDKRPEPVGERHAVPPADAPDPQPDPSPETKWPSQKGVNWLLAHIAATGLIKGATLPELARLAGVKNPSDMTGLGWGKFATGQQAYDQIKYQWQRPPLSKKEDPANGYGKSPDAGPLFAWTRDERQVRKFYDWTASNFKYPDGKTDQALETITGHTLDQFPGTLHDAMAAVLAHACDRDLSAVDDQCSGVKLTCDSQADRGQIHFAARKYCAESATEPEPAP